MFKFYKQCLLSLVCSSAMLFSSSVFAASVLGFWETIDDETGKAKSIVELYEKDGKLYGRVVDLLLKPDDTVCKKCTGDKKNQPVVGMDIIDGLREEDGKYSGADILDPANGKVYGCKLWLEDENTLNMRGYLGIFYRTQTWNRVEDPAKAASMSNESQGVNEPEALGSEAGPDALEASSAE